MKMRYLVEIPFTPEAGHAIENREDGPGPVIERLLKRFKPDGVYMATSERTVFLIVELDQNSMCELMIVGTEMAGRHPRFTPVMSGPEFGDVVGRAVPAAHKILKG